MEIQHTPHTGAPMVQKNKKIIHIILYSLCVIGLATLAFLYQTELARPNIYNISIDETGSLGADFEYGPRLELSNKAYFDEVKKTFIQEKATFIDVNLSDMKLVFYKNGVVDAEYDVAAKGRVGSWWETAPGIYAALSKKEVHKSSFGPVYMPWDIQFNGNFFIHGWPYYEGGRPATSPYSGGCVRLSEADAKKLYQKVDVGTPILVFEDKYTETQTSYVEKGLNIPAESYLVSDVQNNFVFAEKNADTAYPMGRFVHLMLGTIASEYIGIERTLVANATDIVPTDIPRLTAGTSYSLHDLLYILLMESSNEAAHLISRYIGEEKTLELLKSRAYGLGMTHTNMVGILNTATNTTTAEDIFHLIKYIKTYRHFVWDIWAGDLTSSSFGVPPFKNLTSFNTQKISDAIWIDHQYSLGNFAFIQSLDNGDSASDIVVISLEMSDVGKILQDVTDWLPHISERYDIVTK